MYAQERLDTGFHGSRIAKLPFVRGLVVLYETIVGTRWLVRSAGLQAADDGVELGKGSVAIMLLVTFGAVIGIFLVPLFVASATTGGQAIRPAPDRGADPGRAVRRLPAADPAARDVRRVSGPRRRRAHVHALSTATP